MVACVPRSALVARLRAVRACPPPGARMLMCGGARQVIELANEQMPILQEKTQQALSHAAGALGAAHRLVLSAALACKADCARLALRCAHAGG
jgi:hypothetical protein